MCTRELGGKLKRFSTEDKLRKVYQVSVHTVVYLYNIFIKVNFLNITAALSSTTA